MDTRWADMGDASDECGVVGCLSAEPHQMEERMTILRDYIKHLHLNAAAPFPWQVKLNEAAMAEAKSEILRARKLHYGPHLELVRTDRDFCDSDANDTGVDPDPDGAVP